MIPLFTEEERKSCKWRDKLPLQCKQCNRTFYRARRDIEKFLNPNDRHTGDFCSVACSLGSKQQSPVEVTCMQCGKVFLKKRSEYMRTLNHFCCRSCAGTYRNLHYDRKSRVPDSDLTSEQLKERLRQKTYQQEWYKQNAKKVYDNVCSRRNRALSLAKEICGESCRLCGEDSWECIDLHHMDPKTKEYNPSSLLKSGKPLDVIAKELVKCVALCANCHRKVHAGNLSISGANTESNCTTGSGYLSREPSSVAPDS